MSALRPGEVPASVKYKGQRIVFRLHESNEYPEIVLTSFNTVEADPVYLMTSIDANGAIAATEENLKKAFFLRDEARNGRTLIVKIKDAIKFRSRLSPEELCINVKEKRLEVTPKFFWDVYNEHDEPSWHSWVSVCSTSHDPRPGVIKLRLPTFSADKTQKSMLFDGSHQARQGRQSDDSAPPTPSMPLSSPSISLPSPSTTSPSNSASMTDTSSIPVVTDTESEVSDQRRIRRYPAQSRTLYSYANDEDHVARNATNKSSLASVPKSSVFQVIDDSPDFHLGAQDHVCGIIILQQFVYDSEYFRFSSPLNELALPPDTTTGQYSDVAEVSVFCAKSCGSKLLTALVEHAYHHLEYKFLVTASTTTAQPWYHQHGFVDTTAYRLDPATVDLKGMSKRQRSYQEHLYRHRIPDSNLDPSKDEPSHMMFLDIHEQYEKLQAERAKGNLAAVMGDWISLESKKKRLSKNRSCLKQGQMEQLVNMWQQMQQNGQMTGADVNAQVAALMAQQQLTTQSQGGDSPRSVSSYESSCDQRKWQQMQMLQQPPQPPPQPQQMQQQAQAQQQAQQQQQPMQQQQQQPMQQQHQQQQPQQMQQQPQQRMQQQPQQMQQQMQHSQQQYQPQQYQQQQYQQQYQQTQQTQQHQQHQQYQYQQQYQQQPSQQAQSHAYPVYTSQSQHSTIMSPVKQDAQQPSSFQPQTRYE